MQQTAKMLVAVTLLASWGAACSGDAGPSLCNGSEANCGRRYNEVTYAATHNAFSYAEGGPVAYEMPNQDLPIPKQLEAGIRGLGIRPAPYFGDDESQKEIVYITHNTDLKGLLGQEPLVNILTQVRVFLDAHPDEVVTLLAESAVSPQRVAAVFTEAGLDKYLYTHDKARGWPTLSEMIQSGKRLVVFNDSRDATRPAWQLYMWDFIVDTDYNMTDVSQFSCEFYRGEATNDLYFLNQFIYKDYGSGIFAPDKDQAQIANQRELIVERAKKCWQEKKHVPNYVYVDWYAQGDVMGAVNAINAMPR